MSLFYTCETVPLKPTSTYTVTVISINIFWGYLAIFFLYFGQLFLSFFTNSWFNNSSFLKKNMPLKLFLLTRNAFPAWDFIPPFWKCAKSWIRSRPVPCPYPVGIPWQHCSGSAQNLGWIFSPSCSADTFCDYLKLASFQWTQLWSKVTQKASR
jgi:hypothetical protein